MTCTEFILVLKRHPRDCTTAERNAVFNHRDTCKECRLWWENRRKVNKSRNLRIDYTPEEIQEMKQLIEKDFLDSGE